MCNMDLIYLYMIKVAECFFVDLIINHNIPGNGGDVAEAVVVHLHVAVVLQVLHVSISKHR
jgi:hypothetical protein